MIQKEEKLVSSLKIIFRIISFTLVSNENISCLYLNTVDVMEVINFYETAVVTKVNEFV